MITEQNKKEIAQVVARCQAGEAPQVSQEIAEIADRIHKQCERVKGNSDK